MDLVMKYKFPYNQVLHLYNKRCINSHLPNKL